MRSQRMSDTKHPMQPIVLVDGIARFKENRLVRFLVDKYGLNELLKQRYTDDDWSQLFQLMGYSVGSFGGLSFADPETVAKADNIAESLR